MTDSREHRIRVSGLRGRCCEEVRVRNFFVPFGPIESVVVLSEREGVCVVEFKHKDDAVEAVFNTNGAEFQVCGESDSSTSKSVLEVVLASEYQPSSSHHHHHRGKQHERRHHAHAAVWASTESNLQ